MSEWMPKRRLPNGKVAGSRSKYIAAWTALAEPICKATGWKLAAFDPYIKLTSPEMVGTVTLPIDFAQLLVAALEPENDESDTSR